MPKKLDFNAMLAVAIAEARKGLAEGGIPIGAVIFDEHGALRAAEDDDNVRAVDDTNGQATAAYRTKW